jgi:hypothetical protein
MVRRLLAITAGSRLAFRFRVAALSAYFGVKSMASAVKGRIMHFYSVCISWYDVALPTHFFGKSGGFWAANSASLFSF